MGKRVRCCTALYGLENQPVRSAAMGYMQQLLFLRLAVRQLFWLLQNKAPYRRQRQLWQEKLL